ncbi:ABC-type multidrug transport system, ATPase component [Opitutaceae bacterium TAV1]|nr:ABC transporter ATP-binding protein [Opitutaceae bacterium TAV5]EIP97364.1 ABC-type multidrug transport system, ATPase component [Opitutaceae bacterium TAV1]
MSDTPATPPANSPVPAIEIRGLTKDFPISLRGVKLRAVDNLTLTIPEGQVFGLLGPNGSGKSTTIKVILGLLEATLGECRVFGVPSEQVSSRRNVGYLPEAPYFYRYLSGAELVRFYARVCRVPRAQLNDRVKEVIDWVGLSGASHRRVGTYSKGMLQRIGLAQALVHDPRLIVLDEPTAGVDPVGSAEMCELILKLKKQGKTVLITSHLLAQIEDVCDRIAILDRGKLILEGNVSELVGKRDQQALIVDTFSDSDLAAFREWLGQRGHRLNAIEQPRARLDQLFLSKVSRASLPSRSEEKKS